MDERIFTEIELRRYADESTGPLYIAYNGIVYDVTDSPRWRTGIHEGMHFPGQDLTSELVDASHGAEVFQHAGIRRVGRLVPKPQF